MQWEFFNEVDLVDDFDADTVNAWHAEMSAYLSSADAPYHSGGFKRPLTTSFCNSTGGAGLFSLGGIDYVQTHACRRTVIAAGLTPPQMAQRTKVLR